MATGIIGTLGASASLTYTPASNAKMLVSTNSSGASVNGAAVVGAGTTQSFYVGAAQTVTVTTGTSGAAVVTAIEENS